jgi:FKBP-type peptidyl-prolyl cis-trans isomerase
MTFNKNLTMALGLGIALAASGGIARADPVATEPASDHGAFLSANATAEGVVALPGLQYKVLKSGPATGPHPTRADTIIVRYEGQFVNGAIFDTSPDKGAGTTSFPLGKLIPGWVAALQMMRPGDEWIIYVPPYLAYGAAGKSVIPPQSTLVFKVELVGIGPKEPAKP